MPYIVVKMMEGRTTETRKKLMENLTESVQSTLHVDRSQIKVEIQELKEGNFSTGGEIARIKD